MHAISKNAYTLEMENVRVFFNFFVAVENRDAATADAVIKIAKAPHAVKWNLFNTGNSEVYFTFTNKRDCQRAVNRVNKKFPGMALPSGCERGLPEYASTQSHAQSIEDKIANGHGETF